MTSGTLDGIHVLVLAAKEYEELELHYPRLRLLEEGARVTVAGLGEPVYAGRHGYPVKVDADVASLSASDFAGVVIPGGYAPDHLRRSRKVLDLVGEMDSAGKPVAAICHAGWVPVSAGIVRGRTMTSVASIQDDCRNAGAEWVDRPVVVDRNLITSRTPPDLPDFCRAILAALRR